MGKSQKIGVTQGRIAQIESRLGTAKVTLEILLSLLRELGYEYKIVVEIIGIEPTTSCMPC